MRRVVVCWCLVTCVRIGWISGASTVAAWSICCFLCSAAVWIDSVLRRATAAERQPCVFAICSSSVLPVGRPVMSKTQWRVVVSVTKDCSAECEKTDVEGLVYSNLINYFKRIFYIGEVQDIFQACHTCSGELCVLNTLPLNTTWQIAYIYVPFIICSLHLIGFRAIIMASGSCVWVLTAWILGSWVRIPLEAIFNIVVSCVCRGEESYQVPKRIHNFWSNSELEQDTRRNL
jgi:hypothetical protein